MKFKFIIFLTSLVLALSNAYGMTRTEKGSSNNVLDLSKLDDNEGVYLKRTDYPKINLPGGRTAPIPNKTKTTTNDAPPQVSSIVPPAPNSTTTTTPTTPASTTPKITSLPKVNQPKPFKPTVAKKTPKKPKVARKTIKAKPKITKKTRTKPKVAQAKSKAPKTKQVTKRR